MTEPLSYALVARCVAPRSRRRGAPAQPCGRLVRRDALNRSCARLRGLGFGEDWLRRAMPRCAACLEEYLDNEVVLPHRRLKRSLLPVCLVEVPPAGFAAVHDALRGHDWVAVLRPAVPLPGGGGLSRDVLCATAAPLGPASVDPSRLREISCALELAILSLPPGVSPRWLAGGSWLRACPAPPETPRRRRRK